MKKSFDNRPYFILVAIIVLLMFGCKSVDRASSLRYIDESSTPGKDCDVNADKASAFTAELFGNMAGAYNSSIRHVKLIGDTGSNPLVDERKTLKEGEKRPLLENLPKVFEIYGKGEYDTLQFFREIYLTGLIVLKENRILHESYHLGHTVDTRKTSWSMAKSITSALVGIAIDKGIIGSVSDRVSDYVDSLKTSGYKDVTIEQLLMMRSGIEFNEDYGDTQSHINRFSKLFKECGSTEKFAAGLKQKGEKADFHYKTIDTQVLGMVLKHALEKKGGYKDISDFMSRELWSKMGAEYDGYWIIDGDGLEFTGGGFNAALRDYARFGLMYSNMGKAGGQQVVPRSWVEKSVSSISVAPEIGKKFGYGYSWWKMAEGVFHAEGVWLQYIAVYPEQKVVIAMTAIQPGFEVQARNQDVYAFLYGVVKHVLASK